MTRSLSFVLPAFNEADNVVEAVTRCVAVGESLGGRFEVIVVDDGSRDETRVRVDALAVKDARIRAIHHARNQGYGAALRSGLLAARMDRVFFTDADLQFDVAEIASLLRVADSYEIVAGYRAPRRDGPARAALGWGWSGLVSLLFGLEVRDVDCAFKLFDRAIFDEISIASIGALVNTEILVRARARGCRMIQVPVSHYPRRAGVQTGASPRVIAKALAEVLLFWGELRSLAPAPGVSEGRRSRA